VACEKHLDRPPLDQIGLDSYWKTSVDLGNYTARFYEALPKHENSIYTGGYQTSCDDLTYAFARPLMNGETVLSTGTWTSDFSEVRSINIFFDNYQNCQDPFETWQHFLGEAQFFKAWIYFNLVQKYGDVPWYSKALTPDQEEELMRPRDSRTLVIDSILALLDRSFVNIDLRDNAQWNNNSVNKEAVLAFKTRVALYEGTWQKYHAGTAYATSGADPAKYFKAAVDAGTALIAGAYNAGIYTTGNPATDYYDMFGTGDMGDINEVLLYRAYNIGEFIGHNQNFYTANWAAELGATWSFVASHLGQDGKPIDYTALAAEKKGKEFLTALDGLSDPRLSQNIWIPGDVRREQDNLIWEGPTLFEGSQTNTSTGFQAKKYSNTYETIDYANANDQGRIVFRFGEVLLNYAEALFELDGTVAYEQLNLLRERAGMPEFAIIAQTADPNRLDYGYEISDELYEIRRERRVELAFEVLREADWKRWAAHALFKGKRPKGYPFAPSEHPDNEPLVDENGLLDPLQEVIPNGYNFRPDQDYLGSVPQTELTLNPNLTQNPGW